MDLPTELLLEILETLLELRGKANYRSAAYLAQSCRLLRESKAGKQARYIHALTRHSMKVPERLPKHIEYETQVLEQASWPPQPPQQQQPSAPAVLQDAWAAVLGTDGHVALSKDRQSLHYFARQPASTAPEEASGESSTLLRTIHLHSAASAWAVDQDKHRCAVVSGLPVQFGGMGPFLEIWDLVTGVRQTSFQLLMSDGLDFYEEVDHIELNAHYLLVASFPHYQAYSIPQDSISDEAWPIVWSHDGYSKWLSRHATLLSSHFLVQITELGPESEEWSPGSSLRLGVHRLSQTSSRPIAVFFMHNTTPDLSDTELSVVAGAELAPEEVGVVVITTFNRAYLLPIATLVNILYSNGEDIEGQARSFDTDWFDKHTSCIPFSENILGRCMSVSGWKCVFDLYKYQLIGTDEINKLWFVDAFLWHSQTRAGQSSGGSTSVVCKYEYGLSQYFSSLEHNARNAQVTPQLQGAVVLCVFHAIWSQ